MFPLAIQNLNAYDVIFSYCSSVNVFKQPFSTNYNVLIALDISGSV